MVRKLIGREFESYEEQFNAKKFISQKWIGRVPPKRGVLSVGSTQIGVLTLQVPMRTMHKRIFSITSIWLILT